MKKSLFLLLLFFFSLNIFSQKDSIVNYLSFSGKKVSKSNAFNVETIVKKDTVWEVTEYYRNRKIKEKSYFTKKNKSNPYGTFYEYFRDGKIKSFFTYNEKHKLTGSTKMWFNNGKTSFLGSYKDGNKIGVWKYYHYNGKIATKLYYSNFDLVKTLFFDVNGKKIESELRKQIQPKFKGGGLNKFIKRIKKIHDKIDFQINGYIYINFTISIDGSIVNINTTEKIPAELLREMKIFFKNIKGWEPAEHMNRKIPYTYTLPMNFFVNFQ